MTWVDDFWTQVSSTKATAPSQGDIAKYLIYNARTKQKLPEPTPPKGGKSPSVFNRVIDILSRGSYAVGSGLKKYEEGGDVSDVIGAIGSGLAGKTKVSPSQSLFPDAKGPGGFTQRLAADVILDPINLIPVGALSKAFKKTSNVEGLGQVLEDYTPPPPVASPSPRKTIAALPPGPSSRKPWSYSVNAEPGQLKLFPNLEGKTKDLLPIVPKDPPVAEKLQSMLFSQPQGKLRPSIAALPPKLKKIIDENVFVKSADEIIDDAATGDVEGILPTYPKPDHSVLRPFEQDIIDTQTEMLVKLVGINQQKAAWPFNQAKLVNAFHRIVVNLGHNPAFKGAGKEAQRHKRAHTLLRYVEENASKVLGDSPRLTKGGKKFSLAKFLDEVGPENVTREHLTQLGYLKNFDPPIQQAFEKYLAQTSLEEAQKVQPVVQHGLEAGEDVKSNPLLSEAAKSDSIKQQINEALKAGSAVEGLTKAESSAAKELVGDILKRQPAPYRMTNVSAQLMVRPGETASQTLARHLASKKTGKEAAEDLGIKLDEIKNTSNDVSETIGGKALSLIAPWHKQDLVRQSVVENRSLRQSVATLFARDINTIFKGLNPEQSKAVWNAVSNRGPAPADLAIQAQQARKLMENLLGGSGLTEKSIINNTTVTKSLISMEDLNKALQRKGLKDFQFSSAVKDPVTKDKVDLSRGTDWLKSWEYADVKDPAQFMSQVSSGIQDALFYKGVFDDIALRFGRTKPTPGFSKVDHKYLRGSYLPNEVVEQLPLMIKGIEDFYKGSNSKFLKTYDTALRAWKTGVTIYTPAHHIRNMIGDAFLSWMAGVNNPKYYSRAAKVLKDNEHFYTHIDDIEESIGQQAVQGAITATSNRPVAKMRNGKTLDSQQVWTIGYNKGLFPSAGILEDVGNLSEFKLPKPFGGAVSRVAHGVSEKREHYMRMSHFLHALENTSGKTTSEIIDKASREVRKWHPDGLDLTEFERKGLRRLIPFYSWIRKAIPLVVEGALHNPKKMTVYPKVMYNLQKVMGIDVESVSDPFPEDQLFPEWIRDGGIGPLLGGPGNYKIIDPGRTAIPFNSVIEQFSNPQQTLSSSLTPGLKIPMELMTDKNTFTGGPIEDTSQYLDQQLPIVSTLNRIMNSNIGFGSLEALGTGDPSSLVNKKKVDQLGSQGGNMNQEALVNFFTAMGILNTGPYIKQAEFENRDKLAKLRKDLLGG